jgi:hypothetical protein
MDLPQNEFRQGITSLLSYDQIEDEVYMLAYSMGLQELTAGANMEAAVLTGWRVFMPQQDGGALFSEMSLASGGQPSELGSVSQSDRAKAALAAVRALQKMAVLDRWELGWLSVPGVLFEGFWLKAKNPNEIDLIIPVFTLDDQLQSPMLPAAAFLEIIRPFAANRLAHDDYPLYGQA